MIAIVVSIIFKSDFFILYGIIIYNIHTRRITNHGIRICQRKSVVKCAEYGARYQGGTQGGAAK